jgi:hypothetical protein
MMNMTMWHTLATETVGAPFGHLPGHTHHDVTVIIAQRGTRIRIEILNTHGSAQGPDEEHGQLRVVAIDDSLDTAVRIASSRAEQAGIRKDYCVQALSVAHAAAVDALDDLANEPGGRRPTQMAREQLTAWAEDQITEISNRLYEEAQAGGDDSPQTEYQRGRLHATKYAIAVVLGDRDKEAVLNAVRKRTNRPIPHIVPLARDGKRYGIDSDAG